MMGMKGVTLGLLGLMVLTSVINAQRRSRQLVVTSAEVDEERRRLLEEFVRVALRNEQPPPPVLSEGEGERKGNMEEEGNNKSEGKRQEEEEQESQVLKELQRRREWNAKKEIKRTQSLRLKAPKRDSKRKWKAGSHLWISSAKELFLTKVSDFYLTKIRKSFEEGKSFYIVDSRDANAVFMSIDVPQIVLLTNNYKYEDGNKERRNRFKSQEREDRDTNLSDMKGVIFSGVEALKRAGRVKVTAVNEVTSPIHILGVEAQPMRSKYSRRGQDVADLPTAAIDVTGRMVLRVEDNGQGEWQIELKDFFVDDVRGSEGVLYGSDVSLEMLADSFRSASFGSVVKELMKEPVMIQKQYGKKGRSLGEGGGEGGEEEDF